ncbi:putative amine oxidase [copper-containing] [Physella acuta]|uniref:putative amine oxidase [copper-containing] n=1 Tax=Physella acuta TaxID=109671 RepID=UPI0027DB1DDF|nr:putative amine oxidase [copper-containing] [Physella acuta]XP_059166057.1 putative amine oxidase [copper-containing] [Physella acuta]XP_059166058.1 putative amine oxidase [copper-containing] [Physella acuta]
MCLAVCLWLLVSSLWLSGCAQQDGGSNVTSSGGNCSTLTPCGSTNTNGNKIDRSEPDSPGPFHDLTKLELKNLRTFLENDPNIRAVNSSQATVNSSYIYMVDLFLPNKSRVVYFLDHGYEQPVRSARVMMFRGDKTPAVVEEYLCGPLPDIQRCDLLNFTYRRNPVEFTLRPFSTLEFVTILNTLGVELDNKIGYIFRESYNATITQCVTNEECFTFTPSPLGSGFLKNTNIRRMWFVFTYQLPFQSIFPLDFAALFNLDSSDPTNWSIEKVWYAGQMYNTVEDLIKGYDNNTIPKRKLTRPVENEDLFSTLYRRGQPVPDQPQRPPLQVEPDGKRYSLKDRKVDYLGWSFNFRMSPFTGPAIYDVRFKGERIAYEIALAELSVFYSGDAPGISNMNYVDSGALLGIHSKALVPGGDCPEFATLINQTFFAQRSREDVELASTFCLFEQNNGYPLRRHLSYQFAFGSFYGGMLDSVLTLRSAMTIGNYDYIVDFIFHQNGIIETRLLSTGYIQTSFYRDAEIPYGFRLHDNILGNVHHHMAHFKVDLDIAGSSNRYQTLDIVNDQKFAREDQCIKIHQTKVVSNLKKTEKEALYDFHFEKPKYLIVYNEANKTNLGQVKAYRIDIKSVSKNILPEGEGNEPTISWARHQMAVTRHKDEEFTSSSNYGMFDGSQPVVDFTKFYNDDEDIVDKDLVCWVSMGMHHIPHTEDLPVTPSVGNHMTFFLMPYNYFPQCPSMGSRDALYIKHTDPKNPSDGVTINRHGNSVDQCITQKPTLEADVINNPDQVLQTRRPRF